MLCEQEKRAERPELGYARARLVGRLAPVAFLSSQREHIPVPELETHCCDRPASKIFS